MSKKVKDKDKIEGAPAYKIVREAYRNYLTFESLATQSGNFFITNGEVTISFIDLQGSLNKLSARKKEAIYYNVILDKLQRDTAEIMGITTVSVGQYVQTGMQQLVEWVLPEMVEKNAA